MKKQILCNDAMFMLLNLKPSNNYHNDKNLIRLTNEAKLYVDDYEAITKLLNYVKDIYPKHYERIMQREKLDIEIKEKEIEEQVKWEKKQENNNLLLALFLFFLVVGALIFFSLWFELH